jgi:exodeoxyribonuclease VII small subunit
MPNDRDGKADPAARPEAKGENGPFADIAGLSFEEALAELERIVKSLEEGRQKLEEALAAYERGTRLRKYCEAKLAEVENRIEVIVAGEDGAPLATRPFGGEDAAASPRDPKDPQRG